MIPEELKYTEEHEWVRVDGDIAAIGITEHAADELGEIVFCDLPDSGDEFRQADEFGSVESVKTVSSLYIPISGEVIEVNEALNDSPQLANESPYGDGWLIRIKISDASELDSLMDAEKYTMFLEE